MTEIRNLDNKRIGDKSSDNRRIFIRRKNCVTIIQANTDGTMLVLQRRLKQNT